MMRSAIRRLVALLGLLAVGLFLLPGTALAHAVLQSAEPRNGAVLQVAPTWVRVQFNEPVEAAFTPLMVYDRTGRRVDKGDGQVDPGDRSAVIAGLQSLPEGFYTVSYRVSSADGHPVEGAYGFTVGARAIEGEPLFQKAKSPALLPAVGFVHGLSAWVVALLAGVPLFLALIWRPLFPEGAEQRFTLLCAGLAGALILLGLVEVSLYSVRASGEPFGPGILLQGLMKTRVGLFWLLRMGLGLLVGLVLPAIPSRGRWLVVVQGVASAGLLLTLSFTSHAAAAGGALPILADWLHLVAAALWAGGLLGFVVALPGAERDGLPKAVRRFSITMMIALVLLAVTGLYASLQHLGEWGQLFSTDWGLSLVTKLLLLLPLLLLGLINLRREGRRPFRHLVAGELVLITALFVAVGYLTSVPPAKVAALPQGPFAMTQSADGLEVSLRIEPFTFGYNDALVQVVDGEGRPVEGADVGLRLTMTEMEMGKQDPQAEEESPGRYRVDEILLGMDGKWVVEVVILTAQGQEVRVPFPVLVPKLTP